MIISIISAVLGVTAVFGGGYLVYGELDMNNSCEGINEINEVIVKVDSVDVIINGERNSCDLAIKNVILDMMKGSHEMPAFGVSLHNETLSAMNDGVWVELKYNKTYTHNDMPFDALLISVKPEDSGFNIIRNQNGRYEGRCFYISLESNMQSLYEYLTK